MPRADQSDPTLLRIASLANRWRAAEDNAEVEIRRMVSERVRAEYIAMGQAIKDALDSGNFTVMDVARAFTGPDKTPNRNRIYAIKSEFDSPPGQVNNLFAAQDAPPGADAEEYDHQPDTGDYSWRPRVVSTPEGTRTVYDVVRGSQEWRIYEDVIEVGSTGVPASPREEADIRVWMETNPRPGF